MLMFLCGIWLSSVAALVALYKIAPEMDFEVLARGVVPRVRQLQALRRSVMRQNPVGSVMSTRGDHAGSSDVIGSWDWNARTNLVRASAEVNRLFGISAERDHSEVPLRVYESKIHSDDLEWFRRELPRCFGPSGRGVIEYRVIDPWGDTHWIMYRGIYETDCTGIIDRAHGIMLDVTAFKIDGSEVRTAPAPLNHPMLHAADALVRAHAAAAQTGVHELVFHVESALIKVGQSLASDEIAKRARSTMDN